MTVVGMAINVVYVFGGTPGSTSRHSLVLRGLFKVHIYLSLLVISGLSAVKIALMLHVLRVRMAVVVY